MTFYLNPAVWQCMLEFSKKKQANMLGWILTIRCMLYCQFFGEKIPISIWAAKYFTQEICYWQVTGTAAVLFPFSAIFPVYCVHWLSSWVYVNNRTSLMCVYLQVNFLLSRAQLDLKSKSISQLVIMSTMIFHSPENILLRKEKSLWTKSPFGA